jgi:hypothetical protein
VLGKLEIRKRRLTACPLASLRFRVSFIESLWAPESHDKNPYEHERHWNEQDQNATPQSLDGSRFRGSSSVIAHSTTLGLERCAVREQGASGRKCQSQPA